MFSLTLSICCVWTTLSITFAISKGGNVSCSCPKLLKQQLQPLIRLLIVKYTWESSLPTACLCIDVLYVKVPYA